MAGPRRTAGGVGEGPGGRGLRGQSRRRACDGLRSKPMRYGRRGSTASAGQPRAGGGSAGAERGGAARRGCGGSGSALGGAPGAHGTVGSGGGARSPPSGSARRRPPASRRGCPGAEDVGQPPAGGGVTERAAVRERLTVGFELPSRSGKNRCRPGAAEGSSRSHSPAVCRTGSARWCFHSGAAVTALRAELGAESPPGRELLSRGSLPTEGNFYISLFWTKWTLTVISAQLAAAAAALRGENHGTCAQLGTGSALCSPFQQSCR